MEARTTLGPGAAVLGFDVGGTHIKSALFDEAGSMLALRRDATVHDATDPAGALVAQLALIAGELRDGRPDVRPAVAGLSVPGIVDESANRAVFSSNLGWRDAPLVELAWKALRLPIAFGHDVRGAGDVELRLGAANARNDVIVVTIGTGIAATLIIDGRIHVGGGYAGEIGHMLSDPDGASCGCGARGCLETIASASAIARRYSLRSGETVSGALEVRRRMSAGDPHAARAWDDAIEALAVQLQRLCAALAPEMIVIGGGLATAGSALIDPLRRRLHDLVPLGRRPAVVASALGPDAGLLGAALAARDLASDLAIGAVR